MSKLRQFSIDVWHDGEPMCSRVMDARPVIMGREIIIRSRFITIRYDWEGYVRNKIFRTYRSRNPKGWTRTALRNIIRKEYITFDKENELDVHYMDDLFLEWIMYNPDENLVTLTIGSYVSAWTSRKRAF